MDFESTQGFVGAWIRELARTFDEHDEAANRSFPVRFAASLVVESEVDPLVAAECFESAARQVEHLAAACRKLG